MTYRPHYHVARPIGFSHDTIFASLEIWADEPPRRMDVGPFTYVLEEPMKEEKTCRRVLRDGRYVCSECGWAFARSGIAVCPKCGRKVVQ